MYRATGVTLFLHWAASYERGEVYEEAGHRYAKVPGIADSPCGDTTTLRQSLRARCLQSRSGTSPDPQDRPSRSFPPDRDPAGEIWFRCRV